MEDGDREARTFGEEESADLRGQFFRHAIRLAAAFAVLFAAVFFTFWWSGAAVRFGAERVGDRGTPTWRITGTVRSAASRRPIPWATIEDDPGGRPPLYRAEANQFGEFELLTLAEPHRIRIAAPGYRPKAVGVGRVWFLWMPSGGERQDISLFPE